MKCGIILLYFGLLNISAIGSGIFFCVALCALVTIPFYLLNEAKEIDPNEAYLNRINQFVNNSEIK